MYSHGDWIIGDGKKCVSDTCNDREKMNSLGMCETCPVGQKASIDGKSCDPIISCTYNQKESRDDVG